MPEERDATPKFERPPVIETVLGVQFEPLRHMRVTHLGLFYELIKERFAHVEERHPLEPTREVFERPVLEAGRTWRITEHVELPRVWFISEETPRGQQLIQLQRNRFLQNWRRVSLKEQDYPSYTTNREEFRKTLSMFFEFAQSHRLGAVEPNQCELTYVNHIPVDEDCSSVGQMVRRCFPSLSGSHSDAFLPEDPEAIQFTASYRLPNARGRLHIELRPAILVRTDRAILDLRLTARGAPARTDIAGVMAWLDMGHDWVVKGFKSFTSETMHLCWRLTEHG